jgi:FAD dependent oxidoreductase
LGEPSKFGSHQFSVDVNPYWPNGTLLPQINSVGVAAVGSADKKVQSYNFRLCMTANVSNLLPFPTPPKFDSSEWELARRYLAALPQPVHFSSLCSLSPVGGSAKTDTNNNGAISTDCIGCSWDYPTATPHARRAIFQRHYEYQAGFFHFLQTDPALPEQLRQEASAWGLCADEFLETNGWPAQLYVREARRLRGEYVFNQADRQYNLTKADSIGLFSYNIDSHHAQRYVSSTGSRRVLNEGDFELYGGPMGQIPFRSIIPRRAEATNLLAPV